MKTVENPLQPFVKHFTCDRCGREAVKDALGCEFHKSTSVEYRAGYASIFGDQNQVEIDLCQHCVKEVLGQWLRVTERPDPYAGFELKKHDGEFPGISQD